MVLSDQGLRDVSHLLFPALRRFFTILRATRKKQERHAYKGHRPMEISLFHKTYLHVPCVHWSEKPGLNVPEFGPLRTVAGVDNMEMYFFLPIVEVSKYLLCNGANGLNVIGYNDGTKTVQAPLVSLLHALKQHAL